MSSISAPILGPSPRKSYTSLQKLTQRIINSNSGAHPEQESAQRAIGQQTVSIVCISDTHNSKPELPQGDILLHAGDLSQYGTFAEIKDQLAWLRSLPHRHKIVIAGNHDLLLDESFVKSHPDRQLDAKGSSRSDLEWGDVIYLQDELITVDVRGRSITIYGTPWTPRCGSFAFQYDRSDNIWKDKIHPDVDILLVHGPPAVHLDAGKGCESLLTALHQIKPRLAVFGHIHSARGQKSLPHDQTQILYEDIMLGKRHWLAFCQLLLHQMRGHCEDDSVATTLVNAAMPTSTRDQSLSAGMVVEL